MPATKPETRLVSKQDAALALNVSRPTLDRYVGLGLPVVQKPARNRHDGFQIDLDAAQRWLGAYQQRKVAAQLPLEIRVFETVKKMWWSWLRGLLSPETLSMVRNSCHTTDDLIRTAYQMSRQVGRRLEELAERLEANG